MVECQKHRALIIERAFEENAGPLKLKLIKICRNVQRSDLASQIGKLHGIEDTKDKQSQDPARKEKSRQFNARSEVES
jgi:hypothetical protein